MTYFALVNKSGKSTLISVVMKVNPETTQAEIEREQAWAKEREPVVAVLTESYRKAGRPEKFVSAFAKRLDEALKSAQIDGKTFSLNIYDRNAPSKNAVTIELKQNSKERTR